MNIANDRTTSLLTPLLQEIGVLKKKKESLAVFLEGEYRLAACARIPHDYLNSELMGVFCPHPTFLEIQALPLCKVH